MPKPVASCRTTVMDGMEVQNITAPDLLEARAGVVEFLLLNHPLDCPVSVPYTPLTLPTILRVCIFVCMLGF